MATPPQSLNGAPTNGAPKLKRSMGLWMATALVVGNGIEVITIAGSELGRGGPRCMSCPIERDDL